jgi:serine/threonine-protein kinase HipA
MVASSLVLEGDSEELALTLNGRKKNIVKKDLVEVMTRFRVENKAIENMFNKFNSSIDNWHKFIDISFLPDEMKIGYHDLIRKRANQICTITS